MKPLFQAITYAVFLLISAVSFAQQSNSEKYQYCLICHGSAGQGNSVIQAPAIASIDEFYLRQQLNSYRQILSVDHYKVDPAGAEMAAAARDITIEETTNIKEFLSSLETQTVQHDGVDGNVAAGQTTYMQVCSVCHGTAAQGNESLKSPALAHLNDWYVVSSFNKYSDGYRGSSAQELPAQQMRAIVQSMPEDFSIEDIAAYIRSINVGE